MRIAAALAIGAAILAPACRKKVAAPPPLVNLKVGHLPVRATPKFFVGRGRDSSFQQRELNVQLSEFTNSAGRAGGLPRGQLDLAPSAPRASRAHRQGRRPAHHRGGCVMGEDCVHHNDKEKATEIKSVADLEGKEASPPLRRGPGERGGAGRASPGRVWTGGRILQIFEVKEPACGHLSQ